MRAEFDSNPSWEGHDIEVDSKPKKRENGRISVPGLQIQTLFPSTFKVEGNKVVLFFILSQNVRDKGILSF